MAMYLLLPKCPVCGSAIQRDQFKATPPWTCPGCSNKLQFSRSDSGMKAWLGIGLSFAICYLAGFRGWLWLASGVVMWVPTTLLVVAILSVIMRPRLQPYSAPGEASHFTSLFPGESEDRSIPEDRN